MGANYVAVLLAGRVFFAERITVRKALGIALISIGFWARRRASALAPTRRESWPDCLIGHHRARPWALGHRSARPASDHASVPDQVLCLTALRPTSCLKYAAKTKLCAGKSAPGSPSVEVREDEVDGSDGGRRVSQAWVEHFNSASG